MKPKHDPTFCTKVDAEFYRAVHIRAVEKGQTLQGYVCGLIEQDMHPKKELTPEQISNIKKIALTIQDSSNDLAEYLAKLEEAQEDAEQGEGMAFQ